MTQTRPLLEPSDLHGFTAEVEDARALPPGQRMLHGAPYTFDADLLNLHTAYQRVLANAAADLTALSYEDVTTLQMAAFACGRPHRHLPGLLPYSLDGALIERVAVAASNERAGRREYLRVYGGALASGAAA